MQNNLIIGREKEIDLLNKALNSSQSEFIAVYGRRRVGKTYLVFAHLKDKGIYFEFTGIKDADQKTHIKIFTKLLISTFLKDSDEVKPNIPKDWFAALDLLREQIELIPINKKVILFFDELPWIVSAKSNFLQALDNFWNRYISRMPNVILIVCGSVASWMIDNVISNKGGLYGRLTKKIHLLPFTLTETKKFLYSRNIELDIKQIIELYMAIGGIPKYLVHVEPGKSTTQIINELFFMATGYLSNEFYNLYSSLFNKCENHIVIVKTLAKSKNGLTREELLDKAEITSGGTASKVLRELQESGFIIRLEHYHETNPLAKYKLIDQYSLFYLKWVAPIDNLSNISVVQNYWIQQANTIAWQSWCGYAFENVCLMHVDRIQDALGLSGINVKTYIWYSKGTNTKPGAQIDLLLCRADNCINLCEIKYYNQEFEVTKKYGEELNMKKEIFRTQTNCKKSLFTTLITTYGVINNINANEYLQAEITIEKFFV